MKPTRGISKFTAFEMSLSSDKLVITRHRRGDKENSLHVLNNTKYIMY